MTIDVVNSLTIDMIKGIALYLKRHPRVRKKFILISLTLCVISMGLLIINEIYWESNESILLAAVLVGIMSVYSLILVLLSYIVKEQQTLESMLEEIKEEKKIFANKLENQINVFDVIRNNLNQLNEYYVINKVQSKGSYNLSMATIALGFILLIGSIVYMFIFKEFQIITIITSIAGVIFEFIGATSFFLFKESSKSVDKFYNELAYLQKMMLAIELVKNADIEFKNKELDKIITALIDKNNF